MADTYHPTGVIVHEVTPLGRGSDYFGACECCGRQVSETFKHTIKTQISRPDGTTFFARSPGLYGHETCVREMAMPMIVHPVKDESDVAPCDEGQPK